MRVALRILFPKIVRRQIKRSTDKGICSPGCTSLEVITVRSRSKPPIHGPRPLSNPCCSPFFFLRSLDFAVKVFLKASHINFSKRLLAPIKCTSAQCLVKINEEPREFTSGSRGFQKRQKVVSQTRHIRVTWGKMPRRSKTPHQDISEQKLLLATFLAQSDTQNVGRTLAKTAFLLFLVGGIKAKNVCFLTLFVFSCSNSKLHQSSIQHRRSALVIHIEQRFQIFWG